MLLHSGIVFGSVSPSDEKAAEASLRKKYVESEDAFGKALVYLKGVVAQEHRLYNHIMRELYGSLMNARIGWLIKLSRGKISVQVAKMMECHRK